MSTAIIIHYLLTINLLTFIVYGHDKWKAQNPDPAAPPQSVRPRKKRRKKHRNNKRIKHARRRTPEFTLLLLAALGGTLGALLAMHIFRHKTRHLKFTLGVPVMLVVQVLLVIAIAILQPWKG